MMVRMEKMMSRALSGQSLFQPPFQLCNAVPALLPAAPTTGLLLRRSELKQDIQ